MPVFVGPFVLWSTTFLHPLLFIRECRASCSSVFGIVASGWVVGSSSASTVALLVLHSSDWPVAGIGNVRTHVGGEHWSKSAHGFNTCISRFEFSRAWSIESQLTNHKVEVQGVVLVLDEIDHIVLDSGKKSFDAIWSAPTDWGNRAVVELDEFLLQDWLFNVCHVLVVFNELKRTVWASAINIVRICVGWILLQSTCFCKSSEVEGINHSAFVALTADKFAHSSPDLNA